MCLCFLLAGHHYFVRCVCILLAGHHYFIRCVSAYYWLVITFYSFNSKLLFFVTKCAHTYIHIWHNSLGRPYDLDLRYSKTPSFLFNNSSHKYSSQPRLSPTGFSPSSSINSAYKRNRFSNKSRSSTSPNLTANGRHKTSVGLLHIVSLNIIRTITSLLLKAYKSFYRFTNPEIYRI